MDIFVCATLWRPTPSTEGERAHANVASPEKTNHSTIEHCTLKFCRVCGFWVRVWVSSRTSRIFGYRYGSVTQLPEVSDIVAQA